MALSGTGYDFVPASIACQAVGGLHARDQRAGFWQQGTKDARLSDKHPPKIRVKSSVRITGGHVEGAGKVKRTMRATMDDRPKRSQNTPKYRGNRKGATS